jgi:hypothetical protein
VSAKREARSAAKAQAQPRPNFEIGSGHLKHDQANGSDKLVPRFARAAASSAAPVSPFDRYVGRLAAHESFGKAFADRGELTLQLPPDAPVIEVFTG